ncbi:hypothetical protein BGW41_001594 [Actinomortierella wolfii]|nr:hypothetical protein BGW41_001594 [Actinomortierella wolfii]
MGDSKNYSVPDMTLSKLQQQDDQHLTEAITRVRVFLGISQELAPLYTSRQTSDANNVIIPPLVAIPPNNDTTIKASSITLSEDEQDKERAWVVSSLLRETVNPSEGADVRNEPVRVALESVLRWIRSSNTTVAFSTIISLVDLITAWIASSSSSSPSPSSNSSGDVTTSLEEPRRILESMLATLATVLVTAYTNAKTDDEVEELGSLVAGVIGQMAAYASDTTSIPEPVRHLAIGAASMLLGECLSRFKVTEVPPFLLHRSSPTASPKQLAAYEKFLQLVTSDDVWDFLKSLSLVPGANVSCLGSKGSSPVVAVATHAFLSHEMASTLRSFLDQQAFTPSTTEDSCRNLEQKIVREAVAIHGIQIVALFTLYGERLASAQSLASVPLSRRDVAIRMKVHYQLDGVDESGLDGALSHLTSQAAGSRSSLPADKTRYPVPTLPADYGWLVTTVLRQILIDPAFQFPNAKMLLQDSPYSPIYIIVGLLILDASSSHGSSLGVSTYIEQRQQLGDTSCLDTMLNIYLSAARQAKDEAWVRFIHRAVLRALTQLTATASISILQLFGSIRKSTWISLGINCHNTGFGNQAKSASLQDDVGGPLKLLEWIRQQIQLLSDPKQREDVPLLWSMFGLLREWYDQYQKSSVSKDSHIHTQNGGSQSRTNLSLSWPLHLFLQSYCPEILMIGCIEWFRWANTSRPFPVFPKTLAEALDYGLQMHVEASTKAIQSLFQTMIASKFFVVDQRAQMAASAVGSSLGSCQANTDDRSGENANTSDSLKHNGIDKSNASTSDGFSFSVLTTTMTTMYRAWNDFIDEGHGRSVPKLTALFQAELTADTKQRSKKASAEARGVKRGPLASGDSAAGGGRTAGSGGRGDKFETAKKLKSGMSSPFESSLQGGLSSGDSLSSTFGVKTGDTGLKSGGSLQQQQQPPLQLMSSSDLVAQLKAGKMGSGGGGIGGSSLGSSSSTVSNLSNMTQSALQAKVSNPLWAPVLGLSHVPQMQARHQTQIQLEVQRWMTLLAHMDGPTFSEHLTALIKAVYPSDQKFLLDQVLVEWMASEDSAQNETIEGIKRSLKESRYYFVPDDAEVMQTQLANRTKSNDSRASSRFSTEWIVETVIGALVNMVIKPEEQPGYMEPGSLKWTESVPEQTLDWKQILDAQAVMDARSSASFASQRSKWPQPPSKIPCDGSYFVDELQRLAQEEGIVLDSAQETADTLSTSSSGLNTQSPSVAPDGQIRPRAGSVGTAAGGGPGAKKRRLRNLYNRRVSPFYATLIMFQRKWTTSGHGVGMTFLGPDEGGGASPMDGVVESAVATSASSRDESPSTAAAATATTATLLVILQTLTKMNQAGALDAWIVDALSGTIDVVQDRYFEWVVEVLRMRATSSKMETAGAPLSPRLISNPFGRFMTLEQGQAELLRLLPVLTAAAGIGSGPLQRAYQRSVAYHQKLAMADQKAWRMESAKGIVGGADSSDAFTEPTTMHWRQLMALVQPV